MHFATLSESNYFANPIEMIDSRQPTSMPGKSIRLIVPNPLFNFNITKREAARYNMPHAVTYSRVWHAFF